jgi:hypothetical protein
MEKEKPFALDWSSIKSGTMLHMKDFPSVKLLKLDNHKACYFNYGESAILVDIKEHTSNTHGTYYYFKTCLDDWHPLTSRNWVEYDRP